MHAGYHKANLKYACRVKTTQNMVPRLHTKVQQCQLEIRIRKKRSCCEPNQRSGEMRMPIRNTHAGYHKAKLKYACRVKTTQNMCPRLPPKIQQCQLEIRTSMWAKETWNKARRESRIKKRAKYACRFKIRMRGWNLPEHVPQCSLKYACGSREIPVREKHRRKIKFLYIK